MQKFLIIIEKSRNGYGAYSPDIPGCAAVGKTMKETEQKMYEAITLHLEGLKEDGISLPKNRAVAEYIALPEVA